MAKEKTVTCKGSNTEGGNCRIKSGPSGYCHIHDPKRIAERESKKKAAEAAGQGAWKKGERLREVMEVVMSTCKAKGWEAETTNLDKENWRYATISVERTLMVNHSYDTIRGNFDITVNDEGVKVSRQKTSFYGYGIEDLHDGVMAEVSRLPWIESKKKPSLKSPSDLEQLSRLLRRFHVVARQLRHRHKNRETLDIKDEYDVQDLLHGLLKTLFDDVRSEEYTPSYAGGASRMDFLLKSQKVVIETKTANAKLRDRQTGEQLIIDIKRYQSHQNCETLVCFVYDPDGYIRNPKGLENDLGGKHNDVDVHVLVVPQ